MKINDKLAKVGEQMTVNSYDNGFMVEIGGRNREDEWANVKLLCNTLDEVIALLKEYNNLPKE